MRSATTWIPLALALLGATHVRAADAPAAGAGAISGQPPGASDDDTVQIEEVKVTAQRREESANKVPISMSVLSQKSLDDLHIESVTDLTSIVPGLVIAAPATTNNANSDIAIRGIFSGGNTPTTQIYIDETPISGREMRAAGPSGSFFPDIFDLDRVEVLRGPQGTLFGSSAMGGAVRFLTPQPSLQSASGYAKLEIADTESGAPSYVAGAAYGAPVVPGSVGFRVSSVYRYDGGFIDAQSPFTGQLLERNANSSQAFANRAALLIAPTDSLQITPAVFIQHQHSDDLSAYWARPVLGNHVSGDSPSQPNIDNVTIPSLSIKYDLHGLTVQSDTSFLDRWYDTYDDGTQVLAADFGNCILCSGIPSSFGIQQRQYGGTRAWQQELRLISSNTSRFQWVAGAYFRHARETLTQTVLPELSPMTEALFGVPASAFFGSPNYVYNGQSLAEFVDFNTVDESRALFGEVSYEVVSGLKATAGVRVEHSVVKNQTETLAGPLGGGAFKQRALADQVANPVTPRYSLTYQYTDRDMVYGTVSKGYRSGGANNPAALLSPRCPSVLSSIGINSTPFTFDPDNLWSYELGAKDSLFGGRLSVQTSAYYIRWKNIQTEFNLQGCSNFTVNRGEATIQGVEFQFEAVPVAGVKLGGNFSYTDAYHPDALYGAPTNGVPPLLIGAGDKLPQVLPWTAALHAEYSWNINPLWSGARSYIRADYRWQDGIPGGNPAVAGFDPYQNEYRDPAYSTLNLRLGVTRDGVDISAFVDNLTRSDPRLGFQDIGTGGPDYPLAYVSAIRPLTAGVTLLYHF